MTTAWWRRAMCRVFGHVWRLRWTDAAGNIPPREEAVMCCYCFKKKGWDDA